jgi:hypothetical protein
MEIVQTHYLTANLDATCYLLPITLCLRTPSLTTLRRTVITSEPSSSQHPLRL